MEGSQGPEQLRCRARLCQAHREEVAGQRAPASAAEQGMPRQLFSWLGGAELLEDEAIDVSKLTTNLPLQNGLAIPTTEFP